MARFVHQDGSESTDGLQAVLVKGGGQLVGVGGEKLVGPEFGCGRADLAHFGKDLLRPELNPSPEPRTLPTKSVLRQCDS